MSNTQTLAAMIQRLMLMTGMYKYTLQDVRTSDSAKEIASNAKKNKVKNFHDIRTDVAGIERSIQVLFNNIHMYLKSIGLAEHFTLVMREMNSERYKDIDCIFMELVHMPEEDFIKVTEFVNDLIKQNGNKTKTNP